MLIVSFSWMAVVEATPASQRPYIGSSTNNSELGLTFEYNGLGRVEGQAGGPGEIPHGAGALARYKLGQPAARHAAPTRTAPRKPAAPRPSGTAAPAAKAKRPSSSTPVRAKNPIAFGGPTGPLRLFGVGLGDQGGWIVPLAFFGLLGIALQLARDLRAPATVPTAPAAAPTGRRSPRLATTLVLGGWFLLEAIVLSFSKGIVHPYYLSALAPGVAAMAGAGAVAFAELASGRRWDWRMLVIPCAVAGTVAAQLVLLHRERFLHWFVVPLIVGAVLGLVVMLAVRRLAPAAIALTFCLLLVAPLAYAKTTWLAPVEGTFPAAGPTQTAGSGGVGFAHKHLGVIETLLAYVSTHRPGSRWVLLTDASNTASPMILLGYDAGSLAGYSGTDPTLDGPGLARLVARGEARYVVLGGEFSRRGGNRATAAVLRACVQIPPGAWHDPAASPFGLVPYDCAGHERALAGG